MTDQPIRARILPTLPTMLTLLVALAGPPLLVSLSRRVFGEFRALGTQLILHLLFCSFVGLVLFVVIRHERLPLSSIGVRRPSCSTVVSGLLLAAGVYFVLPWVNELLMKSLGLGGFEAGLRRVAVLPRWFRVFVAVTSGTVEETLYRGYAVERLSTITGRAWIGGLIATVAFALAHIPAWGLGPALGADLPFGIVMTLFYLWRRDLTANCIAHSTGLVVRMLAVQPVH